MQHTVTGPAAIKGPQTPPPTRELMSRPERHTLNPPILDKSICSAGRKDPLSEVISYLPCKMNPKSSYEWLNQKYRNLNKKNCISMT